MHHGDDHWDDYNGRQGGRPVRELCRSALRAAGPGRGRTAIDLGCGAGVETRALLDAGYEVYAFDGAPATEAVVTRTLGGRHPRLRLAALHYAEIAELPPADLVYAGYALPYQDVASFERIWGLVLRSLRPGGVLAVSPS